MADPLLNTLCTICHTNPPKYVCPACSASTCSLPCTQKHKSWANCNGRRDPTAFMPASRLRTASGIDHDYNFLTAIERERGRNQREVVEGRGLFTEAEVKGMEDESRFRKMWLGDSVRFEPVRGGPRTFGEDDDGDDDEDDDKNSDGGDAADGNANANKNVPARATYLTRQVRQRLDGLGIQVVQMPLGMTRQRENTTSWNRRARSINWCVEWVVYDGDGDGEYKIHTRIRHKALESAPLYKALGESMAWHRKGRRKGGRDNGSNDDEGQEDDEDNDDEEEPAYARKRRRVLIKEVKEKSKRTTAMQDVPSSAWAPSTPYPTQNPYTGVWAPDRGAIATSWLPDAEVDARRGHRFYLLRPLTPVGRPRELVRVGPAEALAEALRGRSVLEYPTVYVLPPAAADDLPGGFVLGSAERRERPRRNNNNKNAKRKASDNNSNNTNNKDKAQPPNKRQATMAPGEDGLPIRGPNNNNNNNNNSSNNNQRGRGGAVRGARGNGRLQQQKMKGGKRPLAQDPEDGEINSDGDEVVVVEPAHRRPARRPPVVVVRPAAAAVDPADTSSSDPDTSSGEEEEVGVENTRDFTQKFSLGSAVHVDDGDDHGSPQETVSAAAGKKGISRGLGLVEYGSDSDDGSGEDGEEDEDEGVDLAGLKPENPELVANAIKEIVGLLT